MQEYCMPHCSSHLDGGHVKPLTIPLSRDRRPIQGSVSRFSLLQFLNSAFYIKLDISMVRHTVELVDYHPANLQACSLQPNLTDVRTVFDLVHPYTESESRSVMSDSLGSLYSPWSLQARILEWVAFPFPRGSSQPRDRTQVSHIAGGFFTR